MTTPQVVVNNYYGAPPVERVDLNSEVTVTKVDSERGIVFGWANVAIRKSGEQITDHQDDRIDPDDLEDAAYLFNLDFRETGEMHRGVAKGRLIESFAVTPAKLEKMGLAPDALPIAWWVGFQLDDRDTFEKVRRGELSMFSIQGTAERVEV